MIFCRIATVTMFAAATLSVSVLPSNAAVKRHSRTRHHHHHSTNTLSPSALIILGAQSLGRLRSLSRDPITDDQLLRMADSCSSTLAKRGISEASTTIIIAVNLCIPDGATQPLADVFAAYTTLREHGMSPSDAVKQVHGMESTIISGGG